MNRFLATRALAFAVIKPLGLVFRKEGNAES